MEDEEEREERGAMKCDECRREITLGGDVGRFDRGVHGPRGFLPLDRTVFLCSPECETKYFCNGVGDGETATIPRRIP